MVRSITRCALIVQGDYVESNGTCMKVAFAYPLLPGGRERLNLAANPITLQRFRIFFRRRVSSQALKTYRKQMGFHLPVRLKVENNNNTKHYILKFMKTVALRQSSRVNGKQ